MATVLSQMVILLVLVMVLLSVSIYIIRRHNEKVAGSSIYATFWCHDGKRRDLMCPTDAQILYPPPFIRRPDDDDKENPGNYVFDENSTYTMYDWPQGGLPGTKVAVRCVSYREGDAEPLKVRAGANICSSGFLKTARNEVTSSLMMRTAQIQLAKIDELVKGLQQIVRPALIYALLGLSLVLAAANTYALLTVLGRLDRLAGLWGI